MTGQPAPTKPTPVAPAGRAFADDATIDRLAALANRLADQAGPIARRYFRQPVAVDSKPDQSPVTIADRSIEETLRRTLAAERPGDGIHGEEYGVERGDADLLWVIDPIDGTKAFITGRPTFVTLIALLHRGVPVLGLIDQPVVGDRWLGVTGRPTLFNDRPVATRACAGLDAAMLATTGADIGDADHRARFDRLAAAAKITTWGGDGHLFGLMALGLIDMVAEPVMQLYDYAAIAPVVEGAGGRVTDWQGRPLGPGCDGTVLAVGDPALLAPALAHLAA